MTGNALKALNKGDTKTAARLLRRHLIHDPVDPNAWLPLAACHLSDRPDRALLLVERTLAIAPASASARQNAIALLRSTRNLERLLHHLDHSIIAQDTSDLRLLRAETLAAGGRPQDAQRDYRTVLEREPGHFAANVNLAGILNNDGRTREAEVLVRRALVLAPDAAPGWHNLTFGRLQRGETIAALLAARVAATLDILSPVSQVNLAAATETAGLPGVDLALRRAVTLAPDLPDAMLSLARYASRLSDWIRLDAWARRTLSVAPGNADAALTLAQGFLVRGDTKRGWPYWEARLSRPGLIRSDLYGRRWNGEAVAGSRLLLHCEQGFGETLQFVRLVQIAARRSGRILLETVRELAPLLSRSLPEVEVFVRGTRTPPHDYQCSLPSLPAVLDASLTEAPGPVPYLSPDPLAVTAWRQKLGDLPRPWIGFCWRGNPQFVDDRRRSPGLAALRETAGSSASLVSLTKMPTEEDRALMDAIRDPSAQLSTFDDTAGLIAALDVVITSDTAIAHLSGGLGQKTWVMLAHAADWRWLKDRDDAPWYPTATLFRQAQPGDWSTVDHALAARLRADTSFKAAPRSP